MILILWIQCKKKSMILDIFDNFNKLSKYFLINTWNNLRFQYLSKVYMIYISFISQIFNTPIIIFSSNVFHYIKPLVTSIIDRPNEHEIGTFCFFFYYYYCVTITILLKWKKYKLLFLSKGNHCKHPIPNW